MSFYFSAIPPNTRVEYNIEINDSKFFLWQPTTNTNEYDLLIVNAYMYVDVCGVNHSAVLEFEKRFITNDKPYTYHYNGKNVSVMFRYTRPNIHVSETTIITQGINPGVTAYHSTPITQLQRTPYKIYVGFVDHEAFEGNISR
jgi:hypothetical protein